MTSRAENKSRDDRLVLTAREVASALGVSERHVWGMNHNGRLPEPVRFGKAVRWVKADIEAWLAAGAPMRDRWLASESDSSKGVRKVS